MRTARKEDDVSHTFFACDRFAEDRAFASSVGAVALATVVEVMLSSEDAWRAVDCYVHAVLSTRRENGCMGDP